MKIYRYKKDGHLYKLFQNVLSFPYYRLIAEPLFPNHGSLVGVNWAKKGVSMDDFEVAAQR